LSASIVKPSRPAALDLLPGNKSGHCTEPDSPNRSGLQTRIENVVVENENEDRGTHDMQPDVAKVFRRHRHDPFFVASAAGGFGSGRS
jgi:hypothetical protein